MTFVYTKLGCSGIQNPLRGCSLASRTPCKVSENQKTFVVSSVATFLCRMDFSEEADNLIGSNKPAANGCRGSAWIVQSQFSWSYLIPGTHSLVWKS